MGDCVKRLPPALLVLGCVGAVARPAHANTYFVTVAGLGGEPDYEQRFAAMANDLDKLLKASGGAPHVYTLTGGASDART